MDTHLNTLHKEIMQCRKCQLWKSRQHAVPGEGPADTKLMLIGEAPGKKEDETGRPFAGSAGRLLDQMLRIAGLERKMIFITSVIKCRPRIGNRNRRPTQKEIDACKPYLKKQIEIIKPKIICTLGATALQTLLDRKLSISKVHGRPQQKGQFIIFPTFHPAAAMRFPKIRKVLISDLKKLARLLRCSSFKTTV